MPAIRVNRDDVQITVEIEPSDDPPEASFYDPETKSWQEPHPGFAKAVRELEKVATPYLTAVPSIRHGVPSIMANASPKACSS
jgi:hypothetical protein